MILVILYPLAKRFTYWPQLVLGMLALVLTFNVLSDFSYYQTIFFASFFFSLRHEQSHHTGNTQSFDHVSLKAYIHIYP